MKNTYDWLKIVRFHKDIVRHAQDSFYQLEGDGLSGHRFSRIDDYELDSLEGPWIIPSDCVSNQTFRRLLESSEEQDNLVLGLFAFTQWGKLNPILVKEVRVEIDEEGFWNLEPEQARWDISPGFISYLRRNEMAASDNLDEQLKSILERSYDYAIALEANVVDTLLDEFVSEYSFLNELISSGFTRLVIFKTPNGVSIYDKNLMDDYETIEKRLMENPDDIGGLQLLDQISNVVEEDGEDYREVLPVIPLNTSQRNAVQGILKNKPITVVSGPPGCGKSQVVISSLINCWAYGKSVLFASQNNKAVDVVRDRFANINTIVPIAIRAGARSHNTVQPSLAAIRQSCVGISNTAKGSIGRAKSEYEKLLIKRKELQDFLDSKLPSLVDEAYRAALHAHANTLSHLSKIETRHKEIVNSLNELGLVTCKPESVYESVLIPLKNWLGQIKNHLMEIEAEESNKTAFKRKRDSLSIDRDTSLDFCGLDSSSREDWSKVLVELIPENFERWTDDFRTDLRKGYREAFSPIQWEKDFDYWISEEDCLDWNSRIYDWINNIQKTLTETAPIIKDIAELEIRYLSLKEELSDLSIDTSINLPLEIIQDWHSFYGELVTIQESWLNSLPFSKHALLKRKLLKSEAIIRKHLPLELLTKIGDLSKYGRNELAHVLAKIRRWVLFKEDYDRLVQLKQNVEGMYSMLRSIPLTNGISLKIPSSWERDEWYETVNQARRLIAVSQEAGRAWKKRKIYEESIKRIRMFEGQLNKMIGKSFVLSNWLNSLYPDLNAALYHFINEPAIETYISFEEVLCNKRIEQFINHWHKAYTAQKQMNEIDEEIRRIPVYEDHVKKWWEERPRSLALGTNLPPVVFPDNQSYLYKLKDSLSNWYERWDLFHRVEEIQLVESAKREHEYALEKLQYALEIAPSEIEDSSLKNLILSDEVRGIGTPWPEKKLEAALAMYSPMYVKGKIATMDNKIQAHAIKVAEAYWKERVAGKPETLNSLNDYSTQFTRGNISVVNFRKLLEVVPDWVTTTQSTKGFPVFPEIFDVLIVDEASQCTLTNLIPLVYRAKALVVIGDKEQLPAIPSIGEQTERSLAKKYSLDDDDLMALGHCKNDVYETAVRVLPGGITQVYNLDEHYRSLPHIIVFSNQHIYGKRLVLRRELGREIWEKSEAIAGVFKIHVNGSVERGPKNSSWINRMEIDQCISLIQDLKNSPHYAGCSFGIVTPFRAQKEIIEEILANKNLLTGVTVGTAHTFQGDERDIMIFSPVVARNMQQSTIDWVETPHNLVNVAVTRARDALFVIGDYEVMRKQKGVLGKLAKYVEDMEKVRSSSPAEVLLFTFMGMEGWAPLVHPYIGGVEVDFVLEHEGIKLVIEVDGSQHQNQKLVDASRDALLRSKGYRVTRIPARDVLETPNVVIDQLKKEVGFI